MSTDPHPGRARDLCHPSSSPELSTSRLEFIEHALASHRRAVGRDLLPRSLPPREAASALFHAPYAFLSHGNEDDPVVNFANLVAMQLWEMPWERFVATPSRQLVAPEALAARMEMLRVADESGHFADGVSVRISSRGRRFRIEGVLLWPVHDDRGVRLGLAATFTGWSFLDDRG